MLSVGAWGLFGALGNLSHLSGLANTVRGVTSMAGVPDGLGPPWRTMNALVVWSRVAVIVLGKVAALPGGARMSRQVNPPAGDFHRAKRRAVAGCAFVFAFGLWFFGFTVMAEGAFLVFFDASHRGTGAPAFRFAGSVALVALFVAQPELDCCGQKTAAPGGAAV